MFLCDLEGRFNDGGDKTRPGLQKLRPWVSRFQKSFPSLLVKADLASMKTLFTGEIPPLLHVSSGELLILQQTAGFYM